MFIYLLDKETKHVKMAYKKDFNLFIGAKYGVFKALKVTADHPTINKSIQSLQHLSKSADVTALAWSDDDEEEILLGLSNQIVKVYDTNYKAFNSSTGVGFTSKEGVSEGSICGLSRYDGALLTAVESGHIRLWRYKSDTALEMHAGGPLSRMRHSRHNPNIIGTGGQENELKLWDLATGKNIFTAKNVRPDFLQMRVPVWVSDLSFLSDSDKVVVGSRYGYVRMYDPKAQRRPVIKVDLPDKSVSCLTSRGSDMMVLCGLAKGNIQAVDLRMGRPAQKYSGFLGAVRDIASHPTEPYVVSVSLDRYLRIHHLLTKELLFKEYTVSRMNCLLMRSTFTFNNSVGDPESNCDSDSSENVPQELDKVLDSLEQVVDNGKPVRSKKRTCVSKSETLPNKKKKIVKSTKTSVLVNPFAAGDQIPLQTTENKENSSVLRNEQDSDDDIEILSEIVRQSSSDSEEDADEAEGSISDLNSEDAGSFSDSSRTSEEDNSDQCHLQGKEISDT